MVAKILFNTFASLLFIQTVYGQCGLVQQISSGPVSYNVGLQGLQLSNGVQQLGLINPGCGGNLGNVNNLPYSTNVQTIPYTVDSLNIAAGSSYAPAGINVVADNLEIGGQVLVSGSMPFYGAVAINGNVPTSGQGQVQYSTASGVGLSSGGCGYGQPSVVPNNANVNGIQSVNGLNGLVGYGGNVVSGCGCNLY